MNPKEVDYDYLEMTERYYSCFLGASENLFRHDYLEPYFFYTPVRNTPIQGYGHRFDLLAILTERDTFISYGDAAREKIPELRMLLESNALSLYEAIRQKFDKQPLHSFKYYFSGNMSKVISARPLNASDYHAYETFFLANNTNLKDISWLREYFDEMTFEGLCVGVFADNQLVSCTDSPTVPFMKDSIREIGVNTLEKYRKRGYAKDACSCAIREILKQGKCPIWSTNAGNLPSQRLAEALGFKLFGESFSISMDIV